MVQVTEHDVAISIPQGSETYKDQKPIVSRINKKYNKLDYEIVVPIYDFLYSMDADSHIYSHIYMYEYSQYNQYIVYICHSHGRRITKYWNEIYHGTRVDERVPCTLSFYTDTSFENPNVVNTEIFVLCKRNIVSDMPLSQTIGVTPGFCDTTEQCHWLIRCQSHEWVDKRRYDIKNNAWVTVNNDFLSRVRQFGNDFHEWRSHCRIASRVTKIVIHRNECIIFFLHAMLCHEHTNPLRTIIERSFCHCCQGRPFLTEHCDVTTIDLWRHENAKNWHCDVIFVDCHCTRKLAQRRPSLVNNSREYRYLATRYSRLNV